MKAIILTCNTGQGHNSAGIAVCEALQARGVECEVVDALSFVGNYASELLSGFFVGLAVKTPRAFGYFYRTGDSMNTDKRRSPVYYANMLYALKLKHYIVKNEFDIAICPHLFPAEALTYLRRRQGLTLKTYMISTDYTCIPFLDEIYANTIFVPHEDLMQEFLNRGVPAEKLVVSGIPVSEKFKKNMSKSEARTMIGAEQDAKLFLVMSGGDGGGDALLLTKRLLERGDDRTRVIALTGRNIRLREDFMKAFKDDNRVKTFVFTLHVPVFMDACDVLLTKPGGLSSTEAAVKNVPVIHASPIPGVETLNARFFSERGMSVWGIDCDMAVGCAIKLAEDEAWQAHMLSAQRKYVLPDAAERISAFICADNKD